MSEDFHHKYLLALKDWIQSNFFNEYFWKSRMNVLKGKII